LLPGTYRIEVEKLGFKVVIKADLILHVQDSVEVTPGALRRATNARRVV
jgi:hypothetical protein